MQNEYEEFQNTVLLIAIYIPYAKSIDISGVRSTSVFMRDFVVKTSLYIYFTVTGMQTCKVLYSLLLRFQLQPLDHEGCVPN